MDAAMPVLREISIHAPTRGATKSAEKDSIEEQNFNPRSHERSDQVRDKMNAMLFGISIHAPTRGATKTKK